MAVKRKIQPRKYPGKTTKKIPPRPTEEVLLPPPRPKPKKILVRPKPRTAIKNIKRKRGLKAGLGARLKKARVTTKKDVKELAKFRKKKIRTKRRAGLLTGAEKRAKLKATRKGKRTGLKKIRTRKRVARKATRVKKRATRKFMRKTKRGMRKARR